MQKEGSYFTNKPVLFYVGLGLSGFAALLSLIVATVYGACYAHSVYYSGWGVALPIVGAGLFAAAVTVKVFFNKIPYADVIGAVVLWLLSFLGFILFIFRKFFTADSARKRWRIWTLHILFVCCFLFWQ